MNFAQSKQLENLTAGGLLELGNTFSTQGDLKKAEHYFNQAIQFAQANKGRVREARGLSNLGVCTFKPPHRRGIALVQQALDFFQRELPAQCWFLFDADGSRLSPERRLSRPSGAQPETRLREAKQQPAADRRSYLEPGALFFDQEKLHMLEQYDNV